MRPFSSRTAVTGMYEASPATSSRSIIPRISGAEAGTTTDVLPIIADGLPSYAAKRGKARKKGNSQAGERRLGARHAVLTAYGASSALWSR